MYFRKAGIWALDCCPFFFPHVALRPNGALSDIVNAPLKYPSTQIEWELMCHLLSTDYIGRAFEDTVDGRHYLLLLDANRPMIPNAP